MQTMETKDIQIKDIVANKDFMMRQELDKNLVAQYKEILDAILETSPVIVYEINGKYHLVDGFHRLNAARQDNRETIKANVYKGSLQDAYGAACIANLQHGKPLTRNERKKAIEQYIKLNVQRTNVDIAKDVGVSEKTVRRYRMELESSGEIEPQEIRITANGIEQKKKPSSAFADDGNQTLFDEPQIDYYQQWFDTKVLVGDSLEIMPTINRKFDLAIVDPPYGITTEKWDLTNKHELLAFTRRWLNELLKLLKPSSRIYIFWSREYMFDLKPLLDEINETYPLNFGGMLVWYFRNVQSQPDSRKRYKLGWEPIFYYYGLDAPNLHFDDSEISGESWDGKGEIQSDVWTFSIPQSNYEKDKRIHPTQKPLELYKRIIETATKTNESIIDIFAGSGTTGHAAMLTGRDFVLIEQNIDYVAKINDRLKPLWEKDNES